MDVVWEVEPKIPARYHDARSTEPSVSIEEALASDELTALFEGMRERGTILDATVYLPRILVRGGQRVESIDDRRIAGALPFTRRAHELGVEIACGTDHLFDAEELELPALHLELELLVHGCGLSALEALRSATWIGAKVLGRERELGTIEVGKLADLVVLNEDPSENILATRSIRLVVKGGAVHETR